ncbi:MAG: TlpA family protein disulfide reductase [Peptostreptococcaceae bacterium]|nr:TlpA family protein disulfide reductase [Peptostreptococcaceae bacterium]
MKKQILLILLLTILMLSSCSSSENDITMVNIWATWCPPCVAEMPYLAKLNEQLPENVGFIGICTDADQEPDSAKEILETNNATFAVLIPSDEMSTGFLSTVDAIPTTVFVDSDGNIVGNPQIGAPGSSEEAVIEGYLALIDEALNQ